jgi:hypothetical protein
VKIKAFETVSLNLKLYLNCFICSEVSRKESEVNCVKVLFENVKELKIIGSCILLIMHFLSLNIGYQIIHCTGKATKIQGIGF